MEFAKFQALARNFRLDFMLYFAGVVHKLLFQSSAPEIPLTLIQAIISKISDKKIAISMIHTAVTLLIFGRLTNTFIIFISIQYIKYNPPQK